MWYRLAIQTYTVPPCLRWKSTPLSSLDAVLRFLRLYRALPQERLRVFSSASREGFDEQFRLEQGAIGMHSVTAEQFLRERLLSPGDATVETSEQKTHQKPAASFGAIVLSLSLNESVGRIPTMDVQSILDCKRLELERGAGGDHDLPYHFALPATWPLAYTWAALLVQVQHGELQP
jgi:hypothetical protein